MTRANDALRKQTARSNNAARSQGAETRASQESNQDLAGRTERLRESLRLLQELEPEMLQGLENSRRDRVPTTIYVQGYEHCGEIALALLRCAHAYSVSVTLVPYPVQTLNDASPSDALSQAL